MQLTDEQMAEMAPAISAMMQTPGWKAYVAVISAKIAITTQLALMDDPSMLLEHRGEVNGLRAAVASAEDIISTARAVTGEKREARKRSIAAGSASSFE